MNENERLLKLLADKKISKSEFDILAQSLKPKDYLNYSYLLFLINPFKKIAGLKALIVGLFVILAMSYFAINAKVHYPGILDLQYTQTSNRNLTVNYSIIIYQNFINWITLSLFFYLSSKLNGQKGLRINDFLGTVAFARIPYLLVTIVIYLLKSFNLISFESTTPSAYLFTISIIVILGLAWQISTYFFALKESSGMNGKNLWLSFLISIIISEAISVPLTRIFF